MQTQQLPPAHSAARSEFLSDAGTCEPELAAPQPAGNQAALENAGLNPAYDEDGGLAECLADYAPLVLDAMPFPAAIRTAIPFLHLGSVRDWVDQFSLAEVAAGVRGVVSDLIDTLWPVGMGFSLDVNLAGALGAGVAVKGETRMTRTGGDEVTPAFRTALSVSETLGSPAGLGLDGASVQIGQKLCVRVEADGTCKTEFDIVDMLASSMLISSSPLSVLLAGTAARLDPTGRVASLLPWDPESWETTFRLQATAQASFKAEFNLAMLEGSPLYEPVKGALAAARGDGEKVLGPGVQGLARAAARAGLMLEVGTEGAFLEGELSTEAMTTLDGIFPIAKTIAGWTQVKTDLLKRERGDALKLRMGFSFDGDSPSLLSAEVIVEQTRTVNILGTTHKDEMSMSFSDFHAWDTRVAVSPKAALAAALRKSSLGLSRAIAVPVDRTTLDHAMPSWMDRLTGIQDPKAKASLETSFQAQIKGQLRLPAASLNPLADIGIVPPAEMGIPEALMAIGQALLDLRLGARPTVPWLRAHEAELAEAARGISMSEARLVGSVGVGTRGSGSASAGMSEEVGETAKIEAHVGGKVTFDLALDGGQTALLLGQAA